MIRKRFEENSGLWLIEVLVDDEWLSVGSENTEDEAEGVIETLTNWMLSSINFEV